MLHNQNRRNQTKTGKGSKEGVVGQLDVDAMVVLMGADGTHDCFFIVWEGYLEGHTYMGAEYPSCL